MKLNMDTIQFENRYEIADAIKALEQYAQEHPKADNIDTVKELINKLDVMSMSW